MTQNLKLDEIRQTLLGMIRERLFGGGCWLADPETCEALEEKLEPFGLEELDPDSRPHLVDGGRMIVDGDLRPTFLGREINVDLMMVFLGMHDDVEHTLYMNGLISEQEMDEALDRMAELDDLDWSRPASEYSATERLRFYERAAITTVLLPLVRRAFERAESMGWF